MLQVFYVTLMVSTAIRLSDGANILGIFPVIAGSHFRIYRTLLEKLVEKGHEVDVLSHFPRETPLPGYTDYSVRGSFPFIAEYPVTAVKSLTTFQTLQVLYDTCGIGLCESVANTTAVKKLMSTSKKYDLIITEMFITDCLMGYGRLFQAPIIAMTSTVSHPWAGGFIGIPDNPAYIPNIFTPYTQHMSFLERLHNTVSLYTVKIWHNYYALEGMNKIVENIFGKSEAHVRDIMRNISLLMVNSHFSMHQARAFTPNYIEIGGLHINPNETLLRGHENNLKTNLQGVVLLNFGTYFKSESFPKEYVAALFEALEEIPYKILWKGKQFDVPKDLRVPKNIHFIPWLPQLEVLCHPNLKFFITHCGLASVQETIYCGKPILGLPVWYDQPANANAAVSKGIGLSVPFFEITKQKLSVALKELTSNPKYAKNAKKVSKMFRDRPITPLETAVYWTEYVIRHQGAPHLRSKAADLPWYTSHCIDVIVFLLILVILAFLTMYKLLVIVVNKQHTYVSSKLLRNGFKGKLE